MVVEEHSYIHHPRIRGSLGFHHNTMTWEYTCNPAAPHPYTHIGHLDMSALKFRKHQDNNMQTTNKLKCREHEIHFKLAMQGFKQR